MRDVWLAAMLMKPPKVLGRRLRPFSLAHAFILGRAKNPYWIGGKRDESDLVQALDICARTWEENAAWFDAPKIRPLKRFAARLLRNDRHIVEAHKTFEAFLNDSCEVSSREVSEGADVETVSPWEFRVVCALLEMGFTESQAWNMPLNRARCYMDARDESKGEARLVSDEYEEPYSLIVRANKLTEDGKSEEAAMLYAKAQKIFDERRNVA